MQSVMETLQRQTSLFTEEELTYSPEVFRANPSASPEREKARKMIAISGQKCLDVYGKFSRHGSWARTFSALLIGMGDWYSTKCSLTWNLKGTRYNRMYFQLVPSTLPTEGTEHGLLPTPIAGDTHGQLRSDGTASMLSGLAGLGLLPTPTAGDGMRGQSANCTTLENGRVVRTSQTTRTRFGASLAMAASTGLLPTPTSVQRDHPERVEALKQAGGTTMMSRVNGEARPNSILDHMNFYGMLPTPATRDFKGARSSEALAESGRSNTNSLPDFFAQTGQTSQLNPRFVMEMMGFPPTWLELPFQNTETNP